MNPYPYFLYPAISELRGCDDPVRCAELRQFIAANVGLDDALAALIGLGGEDLRQFYPAPQKTKGTDATIDSFIARFGQPTLPASTSAILFEDFKDEAEKPAEDPIETTAEQEQEPTPPRVENPMDEVRILMKKKDYAGALAIMEAFYLNNPKKSVYFADQIRFIKKMMLNESKKKH